MKQVDRLKVLDVMHTLSYIRDGKAHDPKKSATACWEVLNKIVDAPEPTPDLADRLRALIDICALTDVRHCVVYERAHAALLEHEQRRTK